MPPETFEPMVGQFLAKAENDLRAAAILAPAGDLVDMVCFHCQQAIEKMLKAVVLADFAVPPGPDEMKPASYAR